MTIYDIAHQLEVSAATVSLALSGDRRVSERTRRRIQEYARRYGYRRNEQARNFRLKKTDNVALIVHNIDNDFWSGVVRAIENALGEEFNVILCNTEGNLDKERKIFRNLLLRRVDGIIIQPASQEETHWEEAVAEGIPVVSLERTDNPCISFVKGDDEKSARHVTETCIVRGHRNIAFLTFRFDCIGLEERLRGFREAIGNTGIRGEVFVSEEVSREAIDRVFGTRYREFSLIICSDDRLACLLLQLLFLRKISVPEEVSVIGWNDSRFLEYLPTPLASVRIPMVEAGRTAAKIILRNLRGNPVVEKRYVEEQLILRESFMPYAQTGNRMKKIVFSNTIIPLSSPFSTKLVPGPRSQNRVSDTENLI